MQTYCLVCKKTTTNANSKVVKTKNGRLPMNITFVLYLWK